MITGWEYNTVGERATVIPVRPKFSVQHLNQHTKLGLFCQYIGDGEGKRKMGAWCTSQRQQPEKDPAEDPCSAWWVERWGIKRHGGY